MNKRVEILKRIVRYGKKIKLPKKLLVCEVTFVLLVLHIISFAAGMIKCIFKTIFPDKRTVIACVAAGAALSVLIMPHHSNRIDDERVYGNVSEDDTAETGIEIVKADSESETDSEMDTLLQAESDSVMDTLLQAESDSNRESVCPQYTDEELRNLSFYIKVNRLMNCITIYTADEFGNYSIPVKAMTCSTGGENTPLGIYSTRQKYEFRKLLYGVYGQYATRIEGQILFHSSSYAASSKNTLIAEEFNKLGESASHGCIRLTVADAKWIYDYCQEGTVVEIYEDEYPGPLGKPEVITVPEDTVWDPTDDAPENPWNEAGPLIVAEDMEISLGYDIDLLEIVTAYDTCGNDISDRIIINGSVDTFMEGIYEIQYEVTDLLGRKVQKVINISVKGN